LTFAEEMSIPDMYQNHENTNQVCNEKNINAQVSPSFGMYIKIFFLFFLFIFVNAFIKARDFLSQILVFASYLCVLIRH